MEKPLNIKRVDDKIHVVYAGTFNPTKGGAAAAVAAAEFLSDKYHVHIIGFGSEQEKDSVIKQINETKKRTACEITFDGLKLGEEYTLFLQKCDIGLSLQNPDSVYNETSFPSKVVSYLSNGLRVVSIRIKALETSAVDGIITYYDCQDPKEIAKAIMKIKIDDSYDSRSLITKLNNETCISIKKMIEELN